MLTTNFKEASVELQSVQSILDAPWGDDPCIISARGSGISWGNVLVLARDAEHFKHKYICLITRTTFKGVC